MKVRPRTAGVKPSKPKGKDRPAFNFADLLGGVRLPEWAKK